MSRLELRLSGSGGQGVIMASIILAEAAVLSGKYTAQSQSYGPEARGGACKGEVLISDEPIGFTKVRSPDFFLALTQKALDTYAGSLKKDCIVLVDSTIKVPESLGACNVTSLPILATAKEKVGNILTANIVVVCVINRLLKLVPDDLLEEAVRRHIPFGTEEINMKALKEGMKLL